MSGALMPDKDFDEYFLAYLKSTVNSDYDDIESDDHNSAPLDLKRAYFIDLENKQFGYSVINMTGILKSIEKNKMENSSQYNYDQSIALKYALDDSNAVRTKKTVDIFWFNVAMFWIKHGDYSKYASHHQSAFFVVKYNNGFLTKTVCEEHTFNNVTGPLYAQEMTAEHQSIAHKTPFLKVLSN